MQAVNFMDPHIQSYNLSSVETLQTLYPVVLQVLVTAVWFQALADS